MTEPTRFRDGSGPARLLMDGAPRRVPSDARRRALAFTSTAAHLVMTSGTALASGSGSLLKSVVLCVSLGAAGGGVASFAVSETIARLEGRTVDASAPTRGSPAAPAIVATPPVAETKAETTDSDSPQLPPPSADTVGAERPSRGRSAWDRPTSVPDMAGAPPGKAERPSLFEEQRIIESVRAAVARGDVTAALAILDGYQRVYAKGQFHPEALALRIEALSQRGEIGKARLLAAEFRQTYPRHPLLPRVQTAVQR